MANWETTVEIGDIHEAYNEDEIDIKEVGRRVAARLRENKYAEYLSEQIDALEQGEYDADGYDEILSEIYDFGDNGHRIFLNPFTADLRNR